MIAKVTLACSEYSLSIGALEMFNMMKVDLKKDIKEVNSMEKQPFVYEHSIPASIVRSKLP